MCVLGLALALSVPASHYHNCWCRSLMSEAVRVVCFPNGFVIINVYSMLSAGRVRPSDGPEDRVTER